MLEAQRRTYTIVDKKEVGWMKKFYILFAIFITLDCWLDVANAQIVSIPDTNLALVLRSALELPPNAPITKQQMQTLADLNASDLDLYHLTGKWDQEITNITGLEHATRLTNLRISGHSITNLRNSRV